jgi:hypothetical protein
MPKIDVNNAWVFLFSAGSGTQFRRRVADPYRYQSIRSLRNFKPSFTVQLAPPEYLIRIHVMRTRYLRH